MRVADAVVDRSEQSGESVLLLTNLAAGRGDSLARLDRRVADPADLGADRARARNQSVGAALRFADGGSDSIADLARQPLDALA